MTKSEAMKKVQMYEFALIDTGLFLDTHPDNKAALAFYDETRKKYIEATEDYEMQFGPLSAVDSDTDNDWAWVNNPWPWEVED